MGSLDLPAVGALVRPGTGVQPAGIPQAPPTLSVMRAGTQEFSLVGVTWADDPAVTDTKVRVRTQSAGGTWGEWTEFETDEAGPEETATPAAGVRGGTEPMWTGPSTGVEAEVVTRSGAHPLDVHVDLVDPGTSAADSTVVTPGRDGAQAAAAAPVIHTRKEWGANERIRRGTPLYAPAIKALTIHHTVNTNAYTAVQVPAILRGIYRYHAVSRGWGDIGYNVLVDKFGQLWEGRYGGLDRAVIGAHAGGFNDGTVGVSMIGNYDAAATPAPMINAVEAFIAWKFSLAHLDPLGTTRLVSTGGGTSKYPAGATVTLPTIFGHRDVGKTACPGRYGYAQLPQIRKAVAQRLLSVQSSSHSD